MLNSSDIRRQFIDYFVKKCGHTFAPSSPVVPHDDPTLLFANAGMNQFKPYFLGTEKPPYPRAVNSQKCIRAGGKHNDLDDVGKDTYHHTFFEMLGNWSFGDYFKQEAIEWAWDLLVNEWGIDPDRLHATYFEGDASEGLDPDEEARRLWMKYLPSERIHPGNKKDNFWEMGDTGPCGPCSEIHYDGTPKKDGGPLVNQDDARVIEIWNLVFIQFNRDASGKLSSLPAKHVDTGMGFERITAVLQGTPGELCSNYDTDIFQPIFNAIQEVTGARPYSGGGGDLKDPIDIAYRVIADHIRTLTFALSDGAHCGNEGRSYVLRRILRRAVRYGKQQMNVNEPFFFKLVPTVVECFGEFFPELKKNPDAVANELREEEESFRKTLDRGISLFADAAIVAGRKFMVKHVDDNKVAEFVLPKTDPTATNYGPPVDWSEFESVDRPTISAEDAFTLYDTYGFPLDLTILMAEERGMTVDVEGYHKLMAEHQQRSRAQSSKGELGPVLNDLVQKESLPPTAFLGYDGCAVDAQSKLWLFDVQPGGYEKVNAGEDRQHLVAITERSPFYAEQGGQVGDTGVMEQPGGGTFRINDTIKVGDVFIHLGEVEQGPFSASPDAATALKMKVDATRRDRIMSNHTSTHLLNRALRMFVNAEADQRGSLVDDEKLRFDFSNNAAVSPEQIEQVEQQVNDDISRDLPVYAGVAAQDDALKITGLRAVFGEKYPPKVRVVSIGVPPEDLLSDPGNEEWKHYSIEFCGGTHLSKTGDAEGFVITAEESVAKGIRRIVALTGDAAHKAQAEGEALLHRLEALKSAPLEKLEDQLETCMHAAEQAVVPMRTKRDIQSAIADLSQRIKEHRKAEQSKEAETVVETARTIADAADGQNIIIATIEGASADTLRTAMDVIKKKRPDAAMLLAATSAPGSEGDGKVSFLAAVPRELIAKGLKAGDWVREVAKVAGGGGGGRPDMAQAGGKDPAKLDDALAVAKSFANSKIQ